MKNLKKILIIIPFFILSCASAQYLKSYESINAFLDTQKLNGSTKYILQIDKESIKLALRILMERKGLNI